jgi:hypothetical protein
MTYVVDVRNNLIYLVNYFLIDGYRADHSGRAV